MVKIKEKVIGYEVECCSCGCLLEFGKEDECCSSGDPEDYTKEIICPRWRERLVVRDYYGCLLDKVKPIRTREQ